MTDELDKLKPLNIDEMAEALEGKDDFLWVEKSLLRKLLTVVKVVKKIKEEIYDAADYYYELNQALEELEK